MNESDTSDGSERSEFEKTVRSKSRKVHVAGHHDRRGGVSQCGNLFTCRVVLCDVDSPELDVVPDQVFLGTFTLGAGGLRVNRDVGHGDGL